MSTTAPRSLQRGLALLAHLTTQADGLSFTQVVQDLALAPASAARLLAGLEDLGHVRRDPVTGHWCLGPAWLALVGQQSWQERLLLAARPFLKALVERHANTVLLVAWTGIHLVVCDRHLHEDSIAMQRVGRISDRLRAPPWGWLFADRRRLAAERSSPDGDLPDLGQIMGQKALLAERGWVCRIQSDRRRLAAPIHDGQGQAVAALAIGGTERSLPDTAFAAVGTDLVAMARSISRLLCTT